MLAPSKGQGNCYTVWSLKRINRNDYNSGTRSRVHGRPASGTGLWLAHERVCGGDDCSVPANGPRELVAATGGGWLGDELRQLSNGEVGFSLWSARREGLDRGGARPVSYSSPVSRSSNGIRVGTMVTTSMASERSR
jgi:hypothetical protein